MSSIKDKIAFNAGVKSRKEYITESTASSKKEMYVMQRVLNIVSNCVNDIESLKFDLNTPNPRGGLYCSPIQGSETHTVSPEELVEIKKKAYALLMSKMSLVAETIKEVFGVEEKEEKEESGSENDEE